VLVPSRCAGGSSRCAGYARPHAAALTALDKGQAQAPLPLDAETAIALANELVRTAAALVRAARVDNDRFGHRAR